ncbi:hypothetical protein EMCRGX_G024188 [Ephydatia muelleri]
MKHVTAAAQKKTPYKCSVEPYDWFIHSCKSVSKQEMQLVSKVVHSMLDASKENCIRIPTGGTPLTLARVTAPKAPVSDLSVRTRKRRVQELQKTRKILSAGPMDSDILLQDEIRALTKEEKQLLLHDAELAPFSFKLPNGGEGLHGAAYGYTLSLTSKIVQLIEQNEKEGKLSWHGGIIPNDQIWIKLGGDKASSLFKMIFQIVNTPKPNSVHNTCVFSCFKADDTVRNLHVALDRFRSEVDHISTMKWSFIEAGGNLKRAKWYNNCIHDSFFNIPLSQVCIPGLHITQGIFQKLFSLFERACHNLDLKLAMHWKASPMAKSQYDVYSQTLKDLDNALIELEQLNQEAESVQQLQCNCCRCSHSNCGRAPELSGNYYKRVQVQPANVDTLCSCVLKATENVPELKLEAVAVHQKFHIILMQFSKCHVLYDSTVLTQDGIQHLGQAIKNFFCSFDRDFKGIARTLKMHILEDHMLEWLSMHQAGFGLMGEQGAESFHAKFLRTY